MACRPLRRWLVLSSVDRMAARSGVPAHGEAPPAVAVHVTAQVFPRCIMTRSGRSQPCGGKLPATSMLAHPARWRSWQRNPRRQRGEPVIESLEG